LLFYTFKLFTNLYKIYNINFELIIVKLVDTIIKREVKRGFIINRIKIDLLTVRRNLSVITLPSRKNELPRTSGPEGLRPL
jgi:hypothetical protein